MNEFFTVCSIGIGGAFGALLRFYISRAWNQKRRRFPLGTFFVNSVGSLILGWFLSQDTEALWSMVGIGFLGSFTTFSTFVYETLQLFQRSRFRGLLYPFASLATGILFAGGGYFIGRIFVIL